MFKKKIITISLVIAMLAAAAVPAMAAEDTSESSDTTAVIDGQEHPALPDSEPPALPDNGELPTLPDSELPPMPGSDFYTMPDDEFSGMPDSGDFSMPSGDFMPDGENPPMIMNSLPFEDVSENAWYYGVVSRAYEMNLISGMSDTEFAPEASVTGGQLVMMLYRADGHEVSENYSGNWYDEAVAWAAENGIINSEIQWTFDPEAQLTREQMMIVLYRYMYYRGETSDDWADLTRFSDSGQLSDYAERAASWLVAKGYIVGDGETLRPQDKLSRAETAVILVGAVSGSQMNVGNPAFSGGMPGDMPNGMPEAPDGQQGGMPGGFGGSGSVTQGTSVNTISEDGAYSDKTYISTGDDENALRVDGATVTLDSIIVDKASGSSSNTEDGDFYGMNAALLATNGANVTITNANIQSAAQNGNGVFSYGSGTVVNISDSTITTTADNSGGIQTTGGGTTNASNLTVNTSGSSAAAIRSDRGGGTVNVDGGTYTSNGNNSPAVYSTADITVSNAALTANNSEALVIEGKNSITLNNSTVSGNMSENGSSADENIHNVMIYQSMSGDADVGTSEFTMTGGSLTGNSGDMIYVTNTHSIIKLSGVSIVNKDLNGALLRVVGNSASRGWGTAGANGAQVEFTADNQTLEGDIIVDTISTLSLALANGSNFTGTINIVENAQNGTAVDNNAVVTIDAGSTWTLTGDCTVTSLTNNGTINFNGHTIALADGTVLK